MRTARTAQSHGILATLLVVLGSFAGIAPCHRSVPPIDQPQFLQVELFEASPFGSSLSGDDVGRRAFAYPSYYVGVRALKLTYHSGAGLRAGISGFDGSGIPDLDVMGYPWGLSVAPVHVGYDIVFSPKKTALFFGAVPSCYVEATLGAFPPYAKLAAACDIDYYGVGAGIEVGCVDWNYEPNYPGQGTHRSFIPALYASVKIRLLDAAFLLPGRHN